MGLRPPSAGSSSTTPPSVGSAARKPLDCVLLDAISATASAGTAIRLLEKRRERIRITNISPAGQTLSVGTASGYNSPSAAGSYTLGTINPGETYEESFTGSSQSSRWVYASAAGAMALVEVVMRADR